MAPDGRADRRPGGQAAGNLSRTRDLRQRDGCGRARGHRGRSGCPRGSARSRRPTPACDAGTYLASIAVAAHAGRLVDHARDAATPASRASRADLARRHGAAFPDAGSDFPGIASSDAASGQELRAALPAVASRGSALRLAAVVEVDHPGFEATLVEQLKLEVKAGGQPGRTASDYDRIEELVELIDQSGAECLRG